MSLGSTRPLVNATRRPDVDRLPVQEPPAHQHNAAIGDSPVDRRRQGHQHNLRALALDAQDAVAVFLAHGGDVHTTGFADPQSQQAQHRRQGEVEHVRRLAAAVSNASNCRGDSPRVGDSGGTKVGGRSRPENAPEPRR